MTQQSPKKMKMLLKITGRNWLQIYFLVVGQVLHDVKEAIKILPRQQLCLKHDTVQYKELLQRYSSLIVLLFITHTNVHKTSTTHSQKNKTYKYIYWYLIQKSRAWYLLSWLDINYIKHEIPRLVDNNHKSQCMFSWLSSKERNVP